MSEKPIIRIMKQPDWISDDEIAEVLHDAHQTTKDAGMHFTALNQNGADIRRRLGEKGIFFVALTEDNELAGVSGLSFHEPSKAWYAQGKPYCEEMLAGVRGKFKGQGVYSKLLDTLCRYAFEQEDLLVTHTAEHNQVVVQSRLKRGFQFVDYVSWKTTDYYSVVLAKWKDTCPFSPLYLKTRFQLKKMKTRLTRTKNGEKRTLLKKS